MIGKYSDIYIIGGSGFTGKRIVARLIENGVNVYALSRSNEANRTLETLGANPVNGDLSNSESLSRFFEKINNNESTAFIFVSSMGQYSITDIVSLLRHYDIKRAIFTSTSSIFTKLPVKSKQPRLAAEQAIMQSDLDWTIVRPTMIYGAQGDRNLERLIQYIVKLPIPIFPLFDGGTALQQPIHVDDLANVYIELLSSVVGIGKAYNIGGPNPITLKELFDITIGVLNKKSLFVKLPVPYVARFIHLYESLSKHPKLKKEQILRITENKNVDITPAIDDLNFNPRSFFEGISSEVHWFLDKK